MKRSLRNVYIVGYVGTIGCFFSGAQQRRTNEVYDTLNKLEGCIDDERQFKTAKPSQAPGDTTVLKRFPR